MSLIARNRVSLTVFVILQGMKKILAIIFLTVFSLQVLPVRELGKMLYKGMLAEEIHEVETEGKAEGLTAFKWNKKHAECVSYGHDAAHMRNAYLTAIVQLAIYNAAHVQRQYIPDIATPPPNFAGSLMA